MEKITKEQKVAAFNECYDVGDEVIVLDDSGNKFIDRISFRASIMGGHTAMAWLHGKGSYLIDRVIGKPLKP